MSRFWLQPVDTDKYNRDIGPYPTSKMAEAMAATYYCVYNTQFKVIKKDE